MPVKVAVRTRSPAKTAGADFTLERQLKAPVMTDSHVVFVFCFFFSIKLINHDVDIMNNYNRNDKIQSQFDKDLSDGKVPVFKHFECKCQQGILQTHPNATEN